MASSTALRIESCVLRGALEAHTAGAPAAAAASGSSSTSSSKLASLPIDAVTKDEWLQAAAFCYPVMPAPEIESLEEAELLLKVACKYDLQRVLWHVDKYLATAADDTDNMPASKHYIWKWLQLTDESGLEVCLPALAERAVSLDKSGCGKEDKQKRLSHSALRALVTALASTGVYGNCSHCAFHQIFTNMEAACRSCGQMSRV